MDQVNQENKIGLIGFIKNAIARIKSRIESRIESARELYEDFTAVRVISEQSEELKQVIAAHDGKLIGGLEEGTSTYKIPLENEFVQHVEISEEEAQRIATQKHQTKQTEQKMRE